MPEQGQEETVRIVALDRSFHVNCYVCEVRLKPEPVWYCRGVVALSWLERVSTRNVDSCCPLRGRAEAVTHWTATSCARAAAPGASRTCRPKSPPTADFKTPFVTLRVPADSPIMAREQSLLQIRSRLTSNHVSFHSESETFPFCCFFSTLASAFSRLTCRQLGLRPPPS